MIRQSGEALLAILNDVLDLSKIEAGKLELEQVEFDLGRGGARRPLGLHRAGQQEGPVASPCDIERARAASTSATRPGCARSSTT